MLLEELILNDYGNIPQKIGSFLLKNNSSTFTQIQDATGLSKDDVTDGLSILIQRRFVRFFIFEKICKYNIVKSMIKRRLYFPIYTNYVSQILSSKHVKYFINVMNLGILKEHENTEIIEDLIRENILKVESFSSSRDERDKIIKTSVRFLIVNFDFLDQKIFEEETVKYVIKRYNEAAGSVLKALLKCEIIDRDNIINNLDSTKILISDNGILVNEKDNVIEYLKYLCSSGIVIRGFDEKRKYFFNSSRINLKTYKILVLIKDTNMRRIFNLILNKPDIEDKDVTIKSLLGGNKLKMALLSLQKLGLISQKCMGDYSSGTRIDHCWYVDMKTASLSMIKKIEKQMIEKLMNINGCWNGNKFDESMSENADVWVSDVISLATDHLILSLDLS